MTTSPVLTAAEMADAIDMYGYTTYTRPSATVKARLIALTSLSALSLDDLVDALAALEWTNAGSIGTAAEGRYVSVQNTNGSQVYVIDRLNIKVGAARWTL